MSEYKAPAFEAVTEAHALTLRNGKHYTGRPLSFAAVVRFRALARDIAAGTEERPEAVLDLAKAVFEAMHFTNGDGSALDADALLEDLTEQEVTDALATFFPSLKSSSSSETPTPA